MEPDSLEILAEKELLDGDESKRLTQILDRNNDKPIDFDAFQDILGEIGGDA